MRDCTIDIWVLKTIREGGEDCDYFNCVHFLMLVIERRCKVCIDNNGIIFDYFNQLVNYKDLGDLITRWWKFVQRNHRTVWSKLTSKQYKDLLVLHFDRNDLIYVEVSNASLDKKIVTGDSDFGCNSKSSKNNVGVKNYLETQLGITPLTPGEAKEELLHEATH